VVCLTFQNYSLFSYLIAKTIIHDSIDFNFRNNFSH
jgi:hypothetical protein